MNTLLVCTTRRWVADELAPGAERAGMSVIHDNGLWLPRLDPGPGVCVWTPMEQAARLAASGWQLPLTSPGPHWLPSLPRELTGRGIWCGRAKHARQAPSPAFTKVADAKVEHLPAQWGDPPALTRDLPPRSWVHAADTLLTLEQEHRVVALDGRAAASSPYLVDGATYREGMEEDLSLAHVAARAFAQHVLDTVPAFPRAFSLDVALTAQGDWVVLEANPIWSSARYGCDVDVFVAALAAAVDHQGQQRAWRWEPDAYLQDRAARQRPLT